MKKETLFIPRNLMIKGTLLIAWNPPEKRNPVFYLEPWWKKDILFITWNPDDNRNPVFLPWNPNDKSNSIYYLEPRW